MNTSTVLKLVGLLLYVIGFTGDNWRVGTLGLLVIALS